MVKSFKQAQQLNWLNDLIQGNFAAVKFYLFVMPVKG
jgi:hypothetical protein